MLATEVNMEDEEAQSGVAELLNIIHGHINLELNKKGFSVESGGIPSVIDNEEKKVLEMIYDNSFVLPFHSPQGDLYIEIKNQD